MLPALMHHSYDTSGGSSPAFLPPDITPVCPGPGLLAVIGKGPSAGVSPLTWAASNLPIFACNEAAAYGNPDIPRHLIRYDTNDRYSFLPVLPDCITRAYLHDGLLRAGLYRDTPDRILRYTFPGIGLPGPQPTAVLAIAIAGYLYPRRTIFCWGLDSLFRGDTSYHPDLRNPANASAAQPLLLQDQRRRFRTLPPDIIARTRDYRGTPLLQVLDL